MVAKKGKEGCHSGLACSVGSLKATNTQLQTVAQLGKLGELRLEKAVQGSPTLLASGPGRHSGRAG